MKKYDKIILLAKSNLNSIKFVISKALTNSSISMMNFFNIECAKRI